MYYKNPPENGGWGNPSFCVNLKFDGSDAAEIFVKTTTGNVTFSLLIDKVFITKTDTGNINVPKIADGGKCEI